MIVVTGEMVKNYAWAVATQMSDEDKADFLRDPDNWRDGLSCHIIDERGEIYVGDCWDTVRDAILKELED